MSSSQKERRGGHLKSLFWEVEPLIVVVVVPSNLPRGSESVRGVARGRGKGTESERARGREREREREEENTCQRPAREKRKGERWGEKEQESEREKRRERERD